MYKVTWQKKRSDPGEAESLHQSVYTPDYKTAWNLWWDFTEVYKYHSVKVFRLRQPAPLRPPDGRPAPSMKALSIVDDVLRWRMRTWRWRTITPARLAESLSVEGLPYEEIPDDLRPAVLKFRKLRQDQRLRAAKRVLEATSAFRDTRSVLFVQDADDS